MVGEKGWEGQQWYAGNRSNCIERDIVRECLECRNHIQNHYFPFISQTPTKINQVHQVAPTEVAWAPGQWNVHSFHCMLTFWFNLAGKLHHLISFPWKDYDVWVKYLKLQESHRDFNHMDSNGEMSWHSWIWWLIGTTTTTTTTTPKGYRANRPCWDQVPCRSAWIIITAQM